MIWFGAEKKFVLFTVNEILIGSFAGQESPFLLKFNFLWGDDMGKD